MSNTKERILEVALRQFNELGTDAVTVRSVADEVGISHGNLCYHFKNTDVLIEALYQQLVTEVAEVVTLVQAGSSELRTIFQQAVATYRLLYKYRFLMLDFVRICRRLEGIRTHFRELIQLRRVQFRVLCDDMIAAGLLRPPWVEGIYEQLILHSLLFSDAWIPHAEIHSEETGEAAIRHYAHSFFHLVVPYLTEKGLEEYHAIMASEAIQQ